VIAERLADWALNYQITHEDEELASRSLMDTVAVALAAQTNSIIAPAAVLDDAGRWAVLAHVIDFDDLHIPSTTHISTVCVPAVLATGGGAREYLAAAGVMARIGTALGWGHYTAGWHATTTAGPFGAAVAAGLALGLDARGMATALALCVPSAGGVQRAFGTQAKSLQVGAAVDAGIRAARLAAAGADADLSAVEAWLSLVGGSPDADFDNSPAIPGGLAIKLFPACYALQRPIAALRGAIGSTLDADQVESVHVVTPRGTVTPLIHHEPQLGLEGKFSLEYAVATAILDEYQGFDEFTDTAVQRSDAQAIIGLVHVTLIDGGEGLLDGEVEVSVRLTSGETRSGVLGLPPGSPGGPPADELFSKKLRACLHATGVSIEQLTWRESADILRAAFDFDEKAPRVPGEWVRSS